MNILVYIIYGVLLQPDDSDLFEAKLRKASIAIMMIVGIFLLFSTINHSRSLSRLGVSPRTVASNIAGYVLAFTFLGTWAVCRYTKKAGDTLMNVCTTITILATLVFPFCMKDCPYKVAFITCAIFVIIINTKLKWFLSSLCVVGCLLISWEDAMVEKGGLPSLLLPGTDNTLSLMDISIRETIVLLSIFSAFAIVNAVREQWSTQLTAMETAAKAMEVVLAKSTANVQLARDVTEKLVVNDTEGAVTILRDAEQQPDHVVDARMVCILDGLRTALDAFFKYLPRHVVTYLSKSGTLGKIGMHPTRATFSFTDIKGFTTLSTRVKPKDLAQMLTIFYEVQTTIVEAFRGLVDKYIGDCLMVLWGVLSDIGCPNLRACCAALAMDRATKLPLLQSAFSLGKQPLVIRTGIHGGDSLAGNMGSLTRMNYTVIGDPVNTAARLEAVNKDFGTRILASGDVVNALESGMQYLVRRLMTKVRVEGRDQGICVYEILGILPEEGIMPIANNAVVVPNDSITSSGGNGCPLMAPAAASNALVRKPCASLDLHLEQLTSLTSGDVRRRQVLACIMSQDSSTDDNDERSGADLADNTVSHDVPRAAPPPLNEEEQKGDSSPALSPRCAQLSKQWNQQLSHLSFRIARHVSDRDAPPGEENAQNRHQLSQIVPRVYDPDDNDEQPLVQRRSPGVDNNERVINPSDMSPVDLSPCGTPAETRANTRANSLLEVPQGQVHTDLREGVSNLVGDIQTPDIITHARALCHLVSRQEAEWAQEFSDAVEGYVLQDFDKAIPLLQAAVRKATVEHDVKLLCLMLDDCYGARAGVVMGKHK